MCVWLIDAHDRLGGAGGDGDTDGMAEGNESGRNRKRLVYVCMCAN